MKRGEKMSDFRTSYPGVEPIPDPAKHFAALYGVSPDYAYMARAVLGLLKCEAVVQMVGVSCQPFGILETNYMTEAVGTAAGTAVATAGGRATGFWIFAAHARPAASRAAARSVAIPAVARTPTAPAMSR